MVLKKEFKGDTGEASALHVLSGIPGDRESAWRSSFMSQ